MSRAPEDSMNLKEACVRAAREVIAEKGIEHLSLRDVARRLGVSHQAPYRHYPSRDHLLAEVMSRCFKAFAAFLATGEVDGESGQTCVSLGQVGRRYLAYAQRNPLEYKLMFGTPWPEPAAHPEMINNALYAFDVLRNLLVAIHGRGAAERKLATLDAMFIWSCMHGLASIKQANVMAHLDVAESEIGQMDGHAMQMIGRALAGPSG